MVALAILGMGLLVIAAALPAGAKYTKDSIDQVTGAAAAEYALELIEQNVCLRRDILVPASGGLPPGRPPTLFQPRFPQTDLSRGVADPNYEPLIKVRPLFSQNIIAAGPAGTRGTEFFDLGLGIPRNEVLGEAAVRQWFAVAAFTGSEKEYDPAPSAGPWLRPGLPSVALAYPPITADTSFDPCSFWSAPIPMYNARPVLQPIAIGGYGPGAETLKSLERRIVWTAFYRRASYAASSDPTVYEIIVVVSSRPTLGHRFPVQDPSTAGQSVWNTLKISGVEVDALAPIPWLVTFDYSQPQPLPQPPAWNLTTGCPDFSGVGGGAPATLTFRCTADYDPLFPVGSIFIPARNDDQPPLATADNRVHFGPLAPSALPIYEVSQRPDATTVMVKYNGYYPVVNGSSPPGSWGPPAAQNWPVWVIPPASEGVDASGNPIFDNHSPILAVARRYVKLREVP